jgi:NADPH:quinone reductase-like Zn-dependent oxidoreductase
VLGRDFASTVEAAGPGVRSLLPGDAVFGVVTKPALGDGAFGEYVTAPAGRTARVLAGLGLATAGALGLAGSAALAAVDAVAPLPGETVLVWGAADGVGAFAMQLAAARGNANLAAAELTLHLERTTKYLLAKPQLDRSRIEPLWRWTVRSPVPRQAWREPARACRCGSHTMTMPGSSLPAGSR